MLKLWLAAGAAAALAGCVVGPGYGPGYGTAYGYDDQGGGQVVQAAPAYGYGYAPAYGAVGTVDIAVGGRRDDGDRRGGVYRRGLTPPDDHRGRWPGQAQPGYGQRGPGAPAASSGHAGRDGSGHAPFGNGTGQDRQSGQSGQGSSARWRGAQDSQAGGGNGYAR